MIFQPAFQPIVYGPTSEILAYEALARWSDRGDVIAPTDLTYIPHWKDVDLQMLTVILENTDIISRIAPRLFINVSASTIANLNDLSEWMRRLESISSKAKFSIVLEVTEGIEDSKLLEAWPHLKRLGVKLALDDYGDGKSSRGRLVRYDWDYCKFEGQTVQEKEVQESITYCRQSSILPIVERVELQEHSIVFTEMGLHWQQGFLHGKPALLKNIML